MNIQSPGSRLRANWGLWSVERGKWNLNRTLDDKTLENIAKAYGADKNALSATKKLIDPKDEQWKAVGKVYGDLKKWLDANSHPWIAGKGKVLIRQQDTGLLHDTIAGLVTRLDQETAALDAKLGFLKRDAETRYLKDWYDESQYPDRVSDLFSINVKPEALEPPAWLRNENQQAFTAAMAAIEAQCLGAVDKIRGQFLSDLKERVSKLGERMEQNEDGTYKQFGPTTLTNISDMFERFKRLQIGCDGEIEDLVNEVNSIVTPVDPELLKDSATMRDYLSDQMGHFDTRIDELLGQTQTRAFRID